MAIFGPKAWVNPFGKMSIFRLFELLVFIAQKGDFPFQNIVKDIFLGYIALKKKVGKMAIFRPKRQVNPFGKMSIFDFLHQLFLQPRKAIFRSRISKNTFTSPSLPKKKKLEKWPFLDQNLGLTPSEKCQFFDFFEVFVFIAQKGVYSLQNIVKDIFLTYIT